MTAPQVRSITDDELASFLAVARTALHGPPPTEEQVESRRKNIEIDRCLGAFDADGKLCGSARSFATELTVPGGVVSAAGISAVGVLPTHRRQGHLRRMMDHQLAEVAGRGEAVAVLVAAEYPIYGRYGYGPTADACGVRLAVPGPDGWLDPATGRVELVDNARFLDAATELYDRARLRAPGHITYSDDYWEDMVGELPTISNAERRQNAPKVVWCDDSGEVQGAAMYTTDDNWIDNRPQVGLNTDIVLAATDEAEREVLRYLAAVDWVQTVNIGLRPIDDPVPLWLVDGRRATLIDRSDHIWARILDVPAALSARTYATTDRLVIEVDDPMGFASGRFALEAGSDGAACASTSDDPDLRVPVAVLGSTYLGGFSWGRLAAAGWVEELHPGAIDRASALFTTPRAPYCALTF